MATLMPDGWLSRPPQESFQQPGAQANGRTMLQSLGRTIGHGGGGGGDDETGAPPYVWDTLAPPTFNDACAALTDGHPAELFLAMLRTTPTLACSANKFGVTLLHWAAYYNAPLSIIRALVGANAGAARQPTQTDSCLPLHVGAAWGLSHSALAILYAAHPGAAREVDADGRTPAEKAARLGKTDTAALLMDKERMLRLLKDITAEDGGDGHEEEEDMEGRNAQSVCEHCGQQLPDTSPSMADRLVFNGARDCENGEAGEGLRQRLSVFKHADSAQPKLAGQTRMPI
jgi:hypothetical protein